MKDEEILEKARNRIYNWKMRSAYDYARKMPDFPATALVLLEEMSRKFGNCGWEDGEIFEELRQTIDKIDEILKEAKGNSWKT